MITQSNEAVDALSTWNDAAFCAHVEHLAARQGKSGRQLCLAAGLSDGYLNKAAERTGRGVTGLIRLARVAGVSFLELIAPAMEPPDIAIPASIRVTEETIARVSLVADITAHLAVALGARRAILGPSQVSGIVKQILEVIEARP